MGHIKEGKRVVHALDNCTPYIVDNLINNSMDILDTVFFPPNMTFFIQTIDAAVARTFKDAFRHLLVYHLLEYINKFKASGHTEFKVNQAVKIFYYIRMMAKARDLVPKSVVLNSWIITNIFSPIQISYFKSLMESSEPDETANQDGSV